ncbi:hypothetical protein SS1G_03431 [Sclerotinia sclerotiorum 1980 UF-70]|uniref:Uncharacterized protein n=1 Tax=Sclerotinia sclerotiorum (strain ATCC 18683 / 1980 / Ss-1) TaxID=665079 RepID=A7EDP1_SCLS1|nr:hypothetical protein SS1G_03431 [Sclerotinia sclerotiorum 1980 UF-70]EDO00957.1 hypothetical protein SS1G_03431 [Sclerotinia sclerotiorum 1980 UF-70]
MSYYDNQQWSAAGQPSWEQQTPPARSGANSVAPREDSTAFSTQIEEVDRAIDNLVKSGKMFNLPAGGRRDSMPVVGPSRTFPEQFDPRMTAGPPRHHSVSDFGGDARSFSGSNLQNFYASQRHQPSRGANEAEQVMQAKRRMAAQPEILGGKPDRIASPGSGMSEEERRELIARQRSALYGEGPAFNAENGGFDENGTPRPTTQGSTTQTLNPAPGAIRGHSPLAFDHFNAKLPRPKTQISKILRSLNQLQPHRLRVNNDLALIAHLLRRPTLPALVFSNLLLSSLVGLRLPPLVGPRHAKEDARTTSASSNPNSQGQTESGLGWGSKSGVWGNKNLGVQASVWG